MKTSKGLQHKSAQITACLNNVHWIHLCTPGQFQQPFLRVGERETAFRVDDERQIRQLEIEILRERLDEFLERRRPIQVQILEEVG